MTGVKCYEHPTVTVHGTAFGKAAYQTLDCFMLVSFLYL